MLFGAAAAIGWAESKAKADANFALNKVPRPITQLGYTGGTAVALWVGSKLVGGSIGRYARLGARAAAVAAMYQMGKQGGLFTSTTVSGPNGGGTQHYLDDETLGALEAEGTMMQGDQGFAHDNHDGLHMDSGTHGLGALPYDDAAVPGGGLF